MNSILRIATAFIPVIAFVNMLGGFVAGIWLAVKGDWWALGYGLFLLIVSHWLISLLLIPFFLLSYPSMKLVSKGRIFLGRVSFGISSLYMLIVMFLWCIFATDIFLKHPRNAALFPVLLWAYGVATGPWTYLASKDQQSGGNEFSMIAILFLQAGYLVGGVLFLLNPDDASYFIIPLLIILILHWLVQQKIAGEVFPQEPREASF